MSYDDFCRCSPSEFSGIWKQHEAVRREGWEQTRMLALCSLQPYMRRKLTLREFMPFPWEKDEEKDGIDEEWEKQMEGLSDKERFDRAKRLMGAAN